MTEEEFEKLWRELKAADKKRQEEYDALPEEEKKRRKEELDKYDPGFVERISENPFGDDDDDV